MPFTFAHPAAVLPLRRLCPDWLVWSALVIGTVSPDLEHFVRLAPNARWTGSLPAGLAWDLAGGLLLYALLHGLIKRPATLLLPAKHRAAIWPVAVGTVSLTIRRGLAMVASLLIGAGTHRLWDSFTHRDGWGPAHLPALSTQLLEVGGAGVTVFKLLQHGSTLVGLGALGLVYLRWLKRQPPVPSVHAPALRPGLRLAALAAILAPAVTVGVLRGAHAAASSSMNVRAFVVHFGIGVLAGAALALTVVAVVLRCLGDRALHRHVPLTVDSSTDAPKSRGSADVSAPRSDDRSDAGPEPW